MTRTNFNGLDEEQDDKTIFIMLGGDGKHYST